MSKSPIHILLNKIRNDFRIAESSADMEIIRQLKKCGVLCGVEVKPVLLVDGRIFASYDNELCFEVTINLHLKNVADADVYEKAIHKYFADADDDDVTIGRVDNMISAEIVITVYAEGIRPLENDG